MQLEHDVASVRQPIVANPRNDAIEWCGASGAARNVHAADRRSAPKATRDGRRVTSERFERGAAIRREVLGSDYVDRSTSNASSFSAPLQELITEYCWGEIWSRPGLPKKTRSLINIAMLTALDRTDELMLHVRGALRNGCTREEITEVLLQAAVYCGIPAGLASFRAAEQALASELEPAD